MYSRLRKWLALILVFGSGFFVHAFFFEKGIADTLFTNPRSEVLYSKNKEPQENKLLQEKINRAIYQWLDAGKATSISVYYRGYEKGEWMGVNEDLRYAPASMFKVPLAIAYYKYAQVKPEILSKKFVFTGTTDYEARKVINSSEESLERNKPYTVMELIRRMLVYSDNNALAVLEANMDKDFFKEVHTDLGLPFPYVAGDQDFVSPKSFSIIFRMLYNSSYLKRDFSEEILEMLSQSEFRDGLVAKLPSTTVVAHKFGEKTFPATSVREFHDCGIIYNDAEPYSLCIMTKGTDFEVLKGIVADISELVYLENK